MPFDTAYSVCPHDCPSACALAVERLDAATIGRVRGAAGQSYTQGVVCAKVGRYAERQHHPDRLAVPLRRVGEKGRGRDAFRPISWDAALDEIAEKLTRAAQRAGSAPRSNPPAAKAGMSWCASDHDGRWCPRGAAMCRPAPCERSCGSSVCG